MWKAHEWSQVAAVTLMLNTPTTICRLETRSRPGGSSFALPLSESSSSNRCGAENAFHAGVTKDRASSNDVASRNGTRLLV